MARYSFKTEPNGAKKASNTRNWRKASQTPPTTRKNSNANVNLDAKTFGHQSPRRCTTDGTSHQDSEAYTPQNATSELDRETDRDAEEACTANEETENHQNANRTTRKYAPANGRRRRGRTHGVNSVICIETPRDMPPYEWQRSVWVPMLSRNEHIEVPIYGQFKKRKRLTLYIAKTNTPNRQITSLQQKTPALP